MKKHTQHYWAKKLLFLMLSLAAWQSLAITTAMTPPVSVIEDFSASSSRGQFSVTNISSAPVYGFAVGNNEASGAFGFGATNSLLNLIDPSQRSNVWAAGVISRDSWEADNSRFGDFANQAWTVPDTSALNWDTLFGNQFTKVVAYWVVGQGAALLSDTSLNSTPINSGSSQSHFFFFSNQAFSPFVTFGEDGLVTASGETTVVPIPAAFWLFCSALLGFAQFSRKKTT